MHTDKGSVDCETLFICCGVWSPRIARMAGATIPLTPAVHQMISVGPIPLFSDTKGEIEYPIIRDVDTNCYERQNGSDMEVGSYAHRAILMSPDEIPSNEEAALSPTELPFTAEDFDLQMEQALELMPEILTAEGAGIRHAINGLLSLTPDGMPLLGETEVKGVWSLSAVWIKEAAGIARAVAEWATDGHSEIDLHGSDISRLYAHQRTRRHIDARSDEGYNRTYGIVHPMEQWLSNREVRLSPFYAREQELGAVFYETAGWERPWWYESNKGLLEEYGDKVMPREAEWESRWWSPIINAEHLAMRDRAALIDLSAFAIFDVVGSGALEYLQRVALAEMRRRGRPGHLHADPQQDGHIRDRLDDHAARRLALPRGHGRHGRDARHEVVRRPPARRRLGDAARHDLGVVHGRALGAAGARHPRRRSPRRTSRTRASRSRAGAGSRSGRCA